MSASLNRGLELAQGRYLARMDADDVSLPERFSKQVQFLERNPDVGVLGSDFWTIDISGKRLFATTFSSKHGYLRWCLFFQNPFAHPTMMMKRDLIREAGGYSVQYLHAQDYDLWMRLSSETQLAMLRENVFQLRIHADSISTRNGPEQREEGRRIRGEMICKLLGEDGECLASILKGPEPEPSMEAQLIIDLYHRFVSHIPLTDTEKRLIRADAAQRLFLLGFSTLRNWKSWRILASALQLGSMGIGQILFWPYYRFILKTISNPIVR